MLMSVSPFYVAYAQEARSYSLWTIAILLMGASFIKAIKTDRDRWWLVYILVLVFGFYTSLFSIVIAVSQGVYLLFMKQNLLKKYIFAFSLAMLTFSPWLWNIVQNLDLMVDNTTWMRSSFNLIGIISIWIQSILFIFTCQIYKNYF